MREIERGMKASSSSSGDGSGRSPAIPASAKKVVQNLKEIVKKHSDEEIYAALKDCEMDPDHAVHVLMSQDAFHLVKRRRAKRRENSQTGDTTEICSKDGVGISRFDSKGKGANPIIRHSITDERGDSNETLTPIQDSELPTSGNVKNARLQPPKGTRNRSFEPCPSLVNTKTSSKQWTRAAITTDSRILAAPASSIVCLDSNMYLNSGLGRVAAKRQAKPVMLADRIDRKQGEAQNFKGLSFESLRSQNRQERTFGLPDAKTYYQSRSSFRVSHLFHSRVPNLQKSLRWKPKVLVPIKLTVEESSESLQTEKIVLTSLPTSLSKSTEAPLELVSNLEELQLLDEPAVYIPDHLKVCEAECTGLNFGSFDAGFESSFGTGKDDCKHIVVEDVCESYDVCPVQPQSKSIADRLPAQGSRQGLSPSHSSASGAETSTTCSEILLQIIPTADHVSESSKPDIETHQVGLFSSVSVPPSRNESHTLRDPQLQYLKEFSESQPQEVSRVNFAPFADLSSNYGNSSLHPGFEMGSRFQFLPSHTVSKLCGNIPAMNAQTISPSQQQPQNTSMSCSTLAVGQPSIPVRAYASAQLGGVPISPCTPSIYSYQYLPSNYAYMHAPFQPSYPGNSGYLQPPVGSNFSASGRIYPSLGSGPLKFPPPQYKLGSGNTPHLMVAAGFENYQATASGFVGTNSSLTTGSAPRYDEMTRPQYKENSVFTAASPLIEGSALWIQSRGVSGMQSNSYYNVHPPGQHAGYVPSQTGHIHHAATFASYSQAAPVPLNHQLFQQSQALGNLGPVGAGSHAIMYSQPQRGPVNWASSHTSLIRNS